MPKDTATKRFTSRIEYQVNFLAQEWEPLPLPATKDGMSFENLWSVLLASQHVMVADITTDLKPSVKLEQESNEIMSAVARETMPGSEPRWVARQMLVDSPLDVPVDWMQATGIPVEVAAAGEEPSTVIAAWGNGIVENWDGLSEAQQLEVRRGLVDAQVIWSDLTIVSDATLADSSDLFFTGEDEFPIRELDAKRTTTEGAAARIARHNLLRDELYFNVQGIRRDVAEQLLEAWRHPEAVGRVSRRVEEMRQTVELRAQERSKRYQSAVETVLLALGLLTVLDVAIALLSLAFSGADRSPGEGSPLGLLSVLRATNTDWILLGSLLVIISLTAFIYRRGRR